MSRPDTEFRFGLSLPNWFLRAIGPFTRRWLFAPPHALKQFYATNLSKWKGWDRLRALEVPTLVIRGNRDLVFERPLFEKVAASVPGAEEADIGVSGHMVMLERREAVDRSIERFLTDEGQRSWREASCNPQKRIGGRDKLRGERPWLENYEQGVPYTVSVPNIPLHHLLCSSVRREGYREPPRRAGSAVGRSALRRPGCSSLEMITHSVGNSHGEHHRWS